MTCDDRTRELCLYRLQQAEDALKEMNLLKDAGLMRGSVNRAYYAMFYAVQSLVILNKATVLKHSGAISFFDKEFVKTGVIDKKFSKWLHRLFDLRQDSDYGDMYEPPEDQCIQATEHAQEFVECIRRYFDMLFLSKTGM